MRIVVRARNDESGAVLIIVALTLIALMGMIVIVVDVGGLLVARRNIVRAADAAALAAAQSCGRELPAEAPGKADEYAFANEGDARNTVYTAPNCGGNSNGSVHVEYEVEEDLFFAPVLGLGEDLDIPGKATAIWGPPGSGSLTPLMISSFQFTGDCAIPTSPPGTECSFWFSFSDLGTSTIGWLNMNGPDAGSKWGWDVPASHHCTSGGNDQQDWLKDEVDAADSLNWPSPTYVCADTGFVDNDWETLRDLINNAKASGTPLIRLFPVNDPDGVWSEANGGEGAHGQVDKNGNQVDPPIAPDKYDIVGFIALELVDLYDGDHEDLDSTEATDPEEVECSNSPLLNIAFSPAPGNTFDLSPAIADCEASSGESIASTIDIQGKQLDRDYTYDPATHVITWIRFPGGNDQEVDIEISYIEPGEEGTDGKCGYHPPQDEKKQSKCLIARWSAFVIDGSNPGNGADLGVRAVRLLD